MKTKEDLLALGNISKLLQYLYLDKDNYFIVNNGLADLKFYMDDNFYIWSINMNYPDTPPMIQALQPNNWLGIIEKLKEQPPIKFKWFSNTWEEISAVTGADVSLNIDHHKNNMCY